MRWTIVGVLGSAVLLAACGGAGSGGAAAPTASTPPSAAPVVAGTDAPKEDNAGKTADPNASPDYYGY